MECPMKVLHIIDNLSMGGAQSLVKGIVEKQPNNLDLYCYYLRRTSEPFTIEHVHASGFGGYSRFSFVPMFKLKGIILKNQIEILHCHLFRSQVFGWLLKKLWFRDCKLIFHEHGQIVGSDNGNIVSIFLYRLFLKIAQNEVSRFIAISHAVRIKLEGLKLDSPVKVVYNFVDLEKFNLGKINSPNEAFREFAKSKKESDFVVGYAGRLVKGKGWQEFLTSTFGLMIKHSNIHVLIAGGGPDKEEIVGLLRDKKNAHYCGQVSDMRSYYQLLDCFVIPSHWEAMGLTRIEAAACGVPVIASNVEGLNETVADNTNGLLFEAGNQMDLAEKIERLYYDVNLGQRLAEQAMIDVKQYDFDVYLSHISEIYQE